MAYFHRIIKVYGLFIEKDIFHSAFKVRDWNFINSHLDVLFIYLEESRNKKYININANLELIENKVKNVYMKDINIDSLYSSREMTRGMKTQELEHFSEPRTATPIDLSNLFHWFIYSYYQARKITKCQEISNPLNEYHNAFSHMMPLFYETNDENNKERYHKNLTKTRSHLMRGILDSCKVVIEFRRQYIQNDIKLLEKYHKLRKNELSQIGLIDLSDARSGDSLILEYIKYMRELGEIK